MNEEIAALKNLAIEFEGARLPTTKANIAEKAMKILIPLVIHQNQELFSLKVRLSKCQK
ncbi:hypothetical protein NBRC116592_12890 [Colwellia sp. KU-HH00111]|uniref:hypothetical protein n=1 Tax=Colwellia sp. KU-HH00111 TaxID=3127652 RepID=UPI0031055316